MVVFFFFFFLQFLLFLFNLCGGVYQSDWINALKEKGKEKRIFFFLAFNPISL